jgi:hypothetical protein
MNPIPLAFALTLIADSVAADCQVTGPFFNVDRSDSVGRVMTAERNSPCRTQHSVGGSATLSGIRITEQPRSGRVVLDGAATVFTPRQGFTGKDALAVTICGSNRLGSGCSTLKYDVTVR